MSFSFVRGFICSTFGLLNLNQLLGLPPYPVRALVTISSEEDEVKGVDEGREEKRDSLELRTDQFHLLLQVLQPNGWPIMMEVLQVGQSLKWFRNMQVHTQ